MDSLSTKQKMRLEAYKATLGNWHEELLSSQQDEFFTKIIVQSMLKEVDAMMTDAEEVIFKSLINDPEIKFVLNCLYNIQKSLK